MRQAWLYSLGLACALSWAHTDERPNILWSKAGFGATSLDQIDRLIVSPSGQKLATFHRGNAFTAVSVFGSSANSNNPYPHETTIFSGMTGSGPVASHWGSPLTFLEDERYLVLVQGSSLRLIDRDAYKMVNETLERNRLFYAIASRPRVSLDEPLYIAVVGEEFSTNNPIGARLWVYRVNPDDSAPFTLIASQNLGVGAGVCVGWARVGTNSQDRVVVASDSGYVSAWSLNLTAGEFSLSMSQFLAETPTALAVRRTSISLAYTVGTERGMLIDQAGRIVRDSLGRMIRDIEYNNQGTYMLVATEGVTAPPLPSSLLWINLDSFQIVGQVQDLAAHRGVFHYLWSPASSWLDMVVVGDEAIAVAPLHGTVWITPIHRHLVRFPLRNAPWQSRVASNVDGRAVAFSENRLAASIGTTVRVYTLSNQDNLTFNNSTLTYSRVVNDLDMEGTILAVALENGQVNVRDLNNNSLQQTLSISTGAYCVDLLVLQGRIRLAIGTARETLIYEGTQIGNLVQVSSLPIQHTSADQMYVCDVAFRPNDADTVATIAVGQSLQDAQIAVWSLSSTQQLWSGSATWVRYPTPYQIAFVGREYEYIAGVWFPARSAQMTLLSVANGTEKRIASQSFAEGYAPIPVSRTTVDGSRMLVGCAPNVSNQSQPPVVACVEFDWTREDAWISHWHWGHENEVSALGATQISGETLFASASPNGTLWVRSWNRGHIASIYKGTYLQRALSMDADTVMGWYSGSLSLDTPLFARSTGEATDYPFKSYYRAMLATPDGQRVLSHTSNGSVSYYLLPVPPFNCNRWVEVYDATNMNLQRSISAPSGWAGRSVTAYDLANDVLMMLPARGDDSLCLGFLSFSATTSFQSITDTQSTDSRGCPHYANPAGTFYKNIAIDPNGRWAAFVGRRNNQPLIALFQRNNNTWVSGPESLDSTQNPPQPISVEILPRPQDGAPYLLVGYTNGTAILYDPANNWQRLATLNLYRPSTTLPVPNCWAIDYRSGFVAIGGTYSIEFYRYDQQSGVLDTTPLKRYTLEAAPGVIQIALDVSESNRVQDVYYAYTQLTGRLAYASFSVSAACGCPDLNNDGIVDDADLLIVLFNFGTTGTPQDPQLYEQGDVNCDGTVDDADLLAVLFAFGGSC